MKTIYAINSSPRKNENTAHLLQKALDGATQAVAETKLIQLEELDLPMPQLFACKKFVNCQRIVYSKMIFQHFPARGECY